MRPQFSVAAKPGRDSRLPFGVGCLATFLMLGGLFGAALFGVLLLDEHVTEVEWIHGKDFQLQLQRIAGPGDAAVAGAWVVVAISCAIGLFKRKTWAWWVYLLLTLCNLATSISTYASTRQASLLGSAVFAILIAAYWLRPAIRKCFR